MLSFAKIFWAKKVEQEDFLGSQLLGGRVVIDIQKCL